jgi:hypothetical protein
MDLTRTINYLRLKRASLDQIYLVLAIIEIGAYKTPLLVDDFEPGDGLVGMILSRLKYHQQEFTKKIVDDYGPDDFYGYLASFDEFRFDPDELRKTFNAIKGKGDGNYEFRTFEKLD